MECPFGHLTEMRGRRSAGRLGKRANAGSHAESRSSSAMLVRCPDGQSTEVEMKPVYDRDGITIYHGFMVECDAWTASTQTCWNARDAIARASVARTFHYRSAAPSLVTNRSRSTSRSACAGAKNTTHGLVTRFPKRLGARGLSAYTETSARVPGVAQLTASSGPRQWLKRHDPLTGKDIYETVIACRCTKRPANEAEIRAQLAATAAEVERQKADFSVLQAVRNRRAKQKRMDI